MYCTCGFRSVLDIIILLAKMINNLALLIRNAQHELEYHNKVHCRLACADSWTFATSHADVIVMIKLISQQKPSSLEAKILQENWFISSWYLSLLASGSYNNIIIYPAVVSSIIGLYLHVLMTFSFLITCSQLRRWFCMMLLCESSASGISFTMRHAECLEG